MFWVTQASWKEDKGHIKRTIKTFVGERKSLTRNFLVEKARSYPPVGWFGQVGSLVPLLGVVVLWGKGCDVLQEVLESLGERATRGAARGFLWG